jgi:hypothetical protein
LSTVRCQPWRTAKGLYHAKCYRAPFAVRPDGKRTAKTLPCVFGPLPCARGVSRCDVTFVGVVPCKDSSPMFLVQ